MRRRLSKLLVLAVTSITLTVMSYSVGRECRCNCEVPVARVVEQEVATIVEPMPTKIIEKIEEPIIEEPVEEKEELPLTDYEIDLIALVTMAEAEGESEKGKRLVIDTILNRVDHERFPNTVHKVVYQKNQFSSMWNGRVDRCYVDEDIRKLVIEELLNRSNYDVMFFSAYAYSDYGTPLFAVENHYFSSYT